MEPQHTLSSRYKGFILMSVWSPPTGTLLRVHGSYFLCGVLIQNTLLLSCGFILSGTLVLTLSSVPVYSYCLCLIRLRSRFYSASMGPYLLCGAPMAYRIVGQSPPFTLSSVSYLLVHSACVEPSYVSAGFKLSVWSYENCASPHFHRVQEGSIMRKLLLLTSSPTTVS
jgi:hypothetical protein